MYAVTTDLTNAIFFLSKRPEGDHLRIQENVEIDIAPFHDVRFEDSPPPEQILCVSNSDPHLYKLVKYSRDIDHDQYRPTGKEFGGVFSKALWDRFWNLYSVRYANEPADDDPPGVFESLMHDLRRTT